MRSLRPSASEVVEALLAQKQGHRAVSPTTGLLLKEAFVADSFFDQIYEVVRRIPPGNVASYGQIARLLGKPRAARSVGWALHNLPEGSDVPWQRVLNAQGIISLDVHGPGGAIQKAILEEEGIVFDERGRVDMDTYGWTGLDLAELDQILNPARAT
jgi:methylated-DNA-protein-cysteine methyltransferase-like protein